ncbi:MAG: NfeD family protein, partial [Spirochaetaceae bacterium]|nr:NfeD family protein [Spirochaetaceae bacterium]
MDILLFIEPYWFWLAATVVLALIELATAVSLTTIWFAISAFCMVFLSFPVRSFRWQLAIFLAIAVVLLIFTRPVALKKLKAGREKTNVDSLAGKTALVIKPVREFERGEIRIDGVVWTAVSEDGRTLEAGEKCAVSRVEGAHAVVSALESGGGA